jgi:hypothetical protein
MAAGGADPFAQIVCLLAGEASDLRFFNFDHDEESQDRLSPRQIASVMELDSGAPWAATMQRAWHTALQFVGDHQRAISTVGEVLARRGELSGLFVEAMLSALPAEEMTCR